LKTAEYPWLVLLLSDMHSVLVDDGKPAERPPNPGAW
jgi:hypothetical protein